MEEKDIFIQSEDAVRSGVGRRTGYDNQRGLFARVQRFAGRFGVEQRGIERVLPDERTDTSVSKVGTLVRSLTIKKRDG